MRNRSLLAAGIVATSVAAARAEEPGGPSPTTALVLAGFTTFMGTAAGLGIAVNNDDSDLMIGVGLSLAGVSWLFGPSFGHFYSGEVNHGVGFSLVRGALIAGGLALLADHSEVNMNDGCLEFGECRSDAELAAAIVLLAANLGLVVYDLVDAPRSALRARARHRDPSPRSPSDPAITVSPALMPDTRGGLTPGLAFGIARW